MPASTETTKVSTTVTIADVAAEAKVSIKTVSRVLNRETNVKEATREKVEAAMQTLGYRPNSPARMLASNKTFLIGLIYNASSSYITSIQNGVLSACQPEHYDLLIHPCSYNSPSLLENIEDFITNKRVDGLVLVPPVSDVPGLHELLDKHGIANVAISHNPVDETDWSVCTNDRDICKDMVRHLSRLGHHRIAFVQSHPDHKVMAERYTGFAEGMEEVGLEVEPQYIVQGYNSFESGIDCGIQLLRQRPRPTAIFCANDDMASGVMKAAHERRLSIPGDISIAGFDDIPLAAQIWPQLTTVRQPLQAMAELATQELIRLVRGEKPKKLQEVVEAELVVRQSTGPAPADPLI